jgi:hypothetical protein
MKSPYKIVNYSLVILYFLVKIASYFDFKNDNLNSFFNSPWLKFTILFYVFFRLFFSVKRVVTEYKKQNYNLDFYDKITLSLKNGLPNFSAKIQKTIAQEISMIYYSLFSYSFNPQKQKNEFTYHINNTSVSLYWVFILITLVEMGILHLILNNYHLKTMSIILLFINVYSTLFLLAHLNAMKKRFIIFFENSLKINNGLFISEIINYNEIDAILPYNDKIFEFNKVLKIGLIGKLEPNNVIIKLKNEKKFTIIYGLQKKSDFIAFYVDDLLGFEQELTLRLAANKKD